LRVVLDVGQAVKPRAKVLKPEGKLGHRLVVELLTTGAPATGPSKTAGKSTATAAKPVKRIDAGSGKKRDVVVVIDAGHGGQDPGAMGPKGIREKDVVLKIA